MPGEPGTVGKFHDQGVAGGVTKRVKADDTITA